MTSTPESQRWFLQVVGMQAKPPNDECDLDLEELSAACGFLKKKKAYNSQVSNVIRDLEAARRIARIRRFDPVTGACLRTITRLAGESGFIPEHQATAPAATKAHWPKDRSESNAAVLFDVIYELAGGIGKNCHASVRDLAELAFPRKTLKEGKRCVHRAQNVLRRLKCIDWEEGGLDRYRIKALPNCYTVLKLPHWKPETVTPFGLWLDQKMKAFNVSAYKMVKEGGLGKNTVRRMLKSDPRISDDSIDKAIAVLKAHGAQIKTSEIPRP